MDDDRDSYGASMHGFTLTTLNVLITLWAFICVSDSRGLDSSYHVRTNVNVERGTFGGITIHNKYKGWGRGYCFSLVCTFIKAIKFLIPCTCTKGGP